MTTSPGSRISPRERRLVVGFAFFAELMLGYFLLIDPDLTRIAGEPLDLELQSFLAKVVGEAGAKPVAVALPTPAPNASPLPFRPARVSASGPFPAVQQLIERLGKPRYRLGLVSLAVRAESADETQLRVDADLFIEPPQPQAAPSPMSTPEPSPTP